MFFKNTTEKNIKTLSQHEFTQMVDSNLIVKADVNYDIQSPMLNVIVGKYYSDSVDSAGVRTEVTFRAEVDLTKDLKKKCSPRTSLT